MAVINENLEIEFFNNYTIYFFIYSIHQGKLLRKDIDKKIYEEDIIKLDLSHNGFNSKDIKCLFRFHLKNLRILDLIGPDAFCLPKAKLNEDEKDLLFYTPGKYDYPSLSSLESLNLNNNNIGDKGLYHISYSFLSKLNTLYLNNNNITFVGIKHLLKAEFLSNLRLLSLSGNEKIGDNGIKIIKECKTWNKLSRLYLTKTNLTDISLQYLEETSLPKIFIYSWK